MDDPFSKTQPFTLPNYNEKRFVLSPEHWQTFPPPVQLAWNFTKFTKSNATNVPNDKKGVYTFVVKPDVANHPACAYLMYVGKAEDQTLRQRFKQYFQHKTDTSRWPHISRMLLLWEDNLWFYFAHIADDTKIDDTEQALPNSYVPPCNRRFRGIVKRQVEYLFA